MIARLLAIASTLLSAVQRPLAAEAPPRASMHPTMIIAPRATLRAVISNDDRTGAVFCGFRFTTSSARLTLYAAPVTLPWYGLRSDDRRDVAFLDRRGIVVAETSNVQPNLNFGGPPNARQRSQWSGVPRVAALLELAPGALMADAIAIGTRLDVPKLVTASTATPSVPECIRYVY